MPTPEAPGLLYLSDHAKRARLLRSQAFHLAIRRLAARLRGARP